MDHCDCDYEKYICEDCKIKNTFCQNCKIKKVHKIDKFYNPADDIIYFFYEKKCKIYDCDNRGLCINCDYCEFHN